MTKINLFPHYPVLSGDIDKRLVDRANSFDQTRHIVERLNAETERWLRVAIAKGPGWNVWRSNPRSPAGDVFVIIHDFQLLEPGAKPAGTGVVFAQPELTDGERARLLAGRHDWQEQRWEDHCGVDGCGHSCCEDYRRL